MEETTKSKFLSEVQLVLKQYLYCWECGNVSWKSLEPQTSAGFFLMTMLSPPPSRKAHIVALLKRGHIEVLCFSQLLELPYLGAEEKHLDKKAVSL